MNLPLQNPEKKLFKKMTNLVKLQKLKKIKKLKNPIMMMELKGETMMEMMKEMV